jgi:hypothetical protein
MNWRNSARIPENAAPNPESVDGIVAALPHTERVLLACRTGRFEMASWVARMPTVVLTTGALHIAKDRLIGRPRIDRSIPLADITGSGYGPLLGVGPTWEVSFRGAYNAVGTMYFDGPVEAETVEAEIRAAVTAISATADPDLAAFHSSVTAARAQPPGELGKSLSAEQVIAESRRLRAWYEDGNHRAAWERRVELGYGVPSEGVPQPDLFWLDAAPALAALSLGLQEHPMVAMCCGCAESNQDYGDAEQRAVVEEFNRRFFSG